jgi:hypothetical protein
MAGNSNSDEYIELVQLCSVGVNCDHQLNSGCRFRLTVRRFGRYSSNWTKFKKTIHHLWNKESIAIGVDSPRGTEVKVCKDELPYLHLPCEAVNGSMTSERLDI